MLPAVALVGTGLALAYATAGPANLVSVRSKRTNQEYRVQNMPDKQEASELMANVREKLDTLMNRYKNDPATAAEPRVGVMIERFKPHLRKRHSQYQHGVL